MTPCHRFVLLLLACTAVTATEGVPLRIGDAGSMPDPSRFDPGYPEMAPWAAAGVQGGVPYVERVVDHIGPDDDLAAAVAAVPVSAAQPGVLQLAAGSYPIPHQLKLVPGLILRGADRSNT